MQGTLDDFPLPDIIQLISLSKKTGSVEIRSSDGSGTGKMYFVNGRIVSAQLDDLPPSEAILTFSPSPAAISSSSTTTPRPPTKRSPKATS
jgi:hypothetical protein